MKQAELGKLQQAFQEKVQAYQKAGKQDAAKEAELQKEGDNIQKMGQAAQKRCC